MLKRLIRWLLPVESIVAPPAVRMILGSSIHTSRRQWALHLLTATVYIGSVLSFGHQLFFNTTFPPPRTMGMLFILTFAIILGQFLISISAFGMSMSVIHQERRNETWDLVRVTAGGTRQAVRAAWLSILFYRLSGWFGVLVYAPRLFMLGILLFDLLSYRGEYLSYIIGGATPDIPLSLGIILVALTITASFLLPLSAVGVEIAVGLLFSTLFRSRFVSGLLQIGLTMIRAVTAMMGATTMGLLIFGSNTYITEPNGLEWIGLSLAVATGDWGFTLLSAPTLDNVWRTIPYMAYFGVALTAMIVLHLLITEGLLTWAGRRAQRMD
jgi:hypothetical protein